MNLISIDDMTPAPTDEEAAAIGAALEILWPKPRTLDSVSDASQWKFSARWWNETSTWPIKNY
ncbi:MAG: hypothetical protein ACI85J_000297 [Candidatus Poriferisodalaceae bacterium]|jgi:hypothetical protein|nr:hypothetical protein [Acidimicrobiales bacterium]|tara:strand:+ start:1410 stop:1598 length:189 start_codon:yes stop_codon:yes gene_type:complete